MFLTLTLCHFSTEFQSITPTFQKGKPRPKGMERVKQVYTVVNSRAGVSTPRAEVQAWGWQPILGTGWMLTRVRGGGGGGTHAMAGM